MNTKDLISHLLIVGMIFSLLWSFTNFWISLGISFLIGITLLIRATPVSQTSSLTSKFPSLTTTFWVLLVVVIIAVPTIWAMDQWPKSKNYLELRSPECFNDKATKDYGYSRINGGMFEITNGELAVFKTIRITNTGIVWEKPTFKFSIKGIEGRKEERIKVDVLLESRTGSCPFNFTIGPSVGERNVKFGVGEDDYIWVTIDGSLVDIGEKRFNSSGSYDLTVDITSNRADETAETRKNCSLFISSFQLTEATLG